MAKRFFILGILLLASLPAFAQPVDTAWVRRYNGPANKSDVANAIAVDDYGNAYVTGYSWSETAKNYLTLRYYPNGDTAWIRRSYSGLARDIILDCSGNCYVTGVCEGYFSNSYLTIGYDSSGNQVWINFYSECTADCRYREGGANAITIDCVGNIYVTGQGLEFWGNVLECATLKIDSTGELVWAKRYNGGWSEVEGSDIVVDDFFNVYVTGYFFNYHNYNYATIKYDSSGSEIWVKKYGNKNAIPKAIVVDRSGNIYVTGWSAENYTTIKYDSDGNELWIKLYKGFSAPNRAYSMAMDSSGNIYVTGYSYGIETGADYATIKYDSSGNEIWVRRFNGSGNGQDIAYALCADICGNVYVTGYSDGAGTYADYLTIKYDSSGNQLWVERYNGPADTADVALDIALDGSGNVYVTGYSYGEGTDYDYATIKYVQKETFVQSEVDESVPYSFRLSQNYPNPFNQQTVIQYSLTNFAYIILKIYNIKGQLIRTLVSKHQNSGIHQVCWDGRDDQGNEVSTGIYFYRLKAGDLTQTRKMVLLK